MTPSRHTLPHCAVCGSENILRDAWARWDPAASRWELDAIFDHTVCDDCGAPTEPVWPESDGASDNEARAR